MVEITIFELHVEDGIELGPKTIGAEPTDEETPDVSDDTDGRGKLAALLLVVAGLVALVLAAARRAREDGEIELEVEGVN
jgi:hypothetical protein